MIILYLMNCEMSMVLFIQYMILIFLDIRCMRQRKRNSKDSYNYLFILRYFYGEYTQRIIQFNHFQKNEQIDIDKI